MTAAPTLLVLSRRPWRHLDGLNRGPPFADVARRLLVMTLVIEIFVYPNAFDTHGVWAVALLFLMKYGAGTLSLDRLVESRWPSTSLLSTRS